MSNSDNFEHFEVIPTEEGHDHHVESQTEAVTIPASPCVAKGGKNEGVEKPIFSPVDRAPRSLDGSTTRQPQLDNHVSNGALKLDDVLELLDGIERQIEDLRSSCQALIGEKASLLKTLSTVSALSSSESTLSEVDRGELVTTSERLKFRLESVNIELVVKRDECQSESLGRLNELITKLISQVESLSGIEEEDGKRTSVLQTAQLYKEACLNGGTGSKFEGLLVSCTTSDQKEVKARVIELTGHVETALALETRH